jgi:hypothetical protein
MGCKNRQLASFDARVPLYSHWYESQEDTISFQRDYTVEELRATSNEIATAIAKHIFHVFNWMDVKDQMIEDWQKKFRVFVNSCG